MTDQPFMENHPVAMRRHIKAFRSIKFKLEHIFNYLRPGQKIRFESIEGLRLVEEDDIIKFSIYAEDFEWRYLFEFSIPVTSFCGSSVAIIEEIEDRKINAELRLISQRPLTKGYFDGCMWCPADLAEADEERDVDDLVRSFKKID